MITCISRYFPNSVIWEHIAVRYSLSSLYTLAQANCHASNVSLYSSIASSLPLIVMPVMSLESNEYESLGLHFYIIDTPMCCCTLNGMI